MADDQTLLTPALPAPTGSPRPAVAPELDTPLRPWERLAQPGVFQMAQADRRVERYGAPRAPIGRAIVASLLVAAAMAAGVVSALAYWDRRSLLLGVDSDFGNVDLARLAAADDAIADASRITLVATIVAGVAVLAWTYRAYRTVAAWRPIELRLRWAILGWIVPIANLIVPLRILTEITEGSSRGGHGRRLPLLWWALWTLPLIGTIGLRGFEPTTADGFKVWDSLATVTTACTACAGAVLIAIIVRSTFDQRHRLVERQRLSAAGA